MVQLPSLQAITAPFQSKEAFREFIKTEDGDGTHTVASSRWTNKDLEPTSREQRTWTWHNLPMFWFTTAFGVTGWNVAASLIATGLTWRQAFISAVLGSLISALCAIGMARPGVMYHIGYPVLARSTLGMYGSFFFIFIRAVVCCFWYGIQSFYGANLLSVCFRACFGHNWTQWPNTIPLSASVTSQQLLCFFLVWLLELPFMFVHPRNIHWLFTVKGAILPFVTFGLFGWCMAHGVGLATIDTTGAAAASKLSLGWAVMNGINTVLGSLSPMLVNSPDLARYCKKPRDAGWLQGMAIFSSKVIVFFLGMAATSSIQGAWGTAYWNVWDLLNAILDHYWTPAARTAVFLVSLSFMISQFGINFGGNSIPFGADASGLFPKYLTIRRGQVVCAILGIAVVPWKLIASASAFISFLGSYNIFMAPLCAIIIVDYFIVRKGNLHVPSMYDGTKSGLYWFQGGVNWVGVFSWCGGVAMGLPGLVGQYRPRAVNAAAMEMYSMGWILTFATAFVLYLALTFFFKPRVFPAGFETVPMTYEYLGKDGREGYFDGERDGLGAPISPTLSSEDLKEKSGNTKSEVLEV